MARDRKSPFLIFLLPAERAELEHWQHSTTIQAGLARRAKIILSRAAGLPLANIARRLAMGRRIVRKWLQRFINKHMPGLADKGALSELTPQEGDWCVGPLRVGLRCRCQAHQLGKTLLMDRSSLLE